MTSGAGPDAGRLRAARLGRFALAATTGVTLLIVWGQLTASGGGPVDARAFYELDPNHLYVADDSAYLWSPAFAELTAPLRLLPFDAFVAVIRAVDLGALALLAPFGAWIAIWLTPVASEVNAGNINLLLILCVAASLRWPAAWLLPLITKPTMGVGLLWYVARGEWRRLGVAVGLTAVVCGVSFAFNPQAWIDWVTFLRAFSPVPGWPFPIPIWFRMPVAIVVVWVGAKTDRPWALPLAAIIGMPRLYFLSIAMLVGLLPTLGRTSRLAFGQGGTMRAEGLQSASA